MRATEIQVRKATALLRREADEDQERVIMPDHVFYSVDAKLPAGEVERVLQDEASTVAGHIRAERQKARAAR